MPRWITRVRALQKSEESPSAARKRKCPQAFTLLLRPSDPAHPVKTRVRSSASAVPNEGLSGSIRRQRVNHLVVLSEAHLRGSCGSHTPLGTTSAVHETDC